MQKEGMSAATMSLDKRDIGPILKSAFPPPGGAVQRQESRTLKQAVRRLDHEVDELVATLGVPFHETLQELAERIAR